MRSSVCRACLLVCILTIAAVLGPFALRTAAAASPPPVLEDSTAEDAPAAAAYEAFLVRLYNDLVREGGLPGEPVSDAAAFWQKVDTAKLSQALSARLGPAAGGWVTEGRIYPSGTSFDVTIDGQDVVSLVVDKMAYPAQVRRGAVDCTVTAVDDSTASLRNVVAGNVQCLFATEVRSSYLANGGEPGGRVTPEDVAASQADKAIKGYLDGLIGRGLLKGYTLDLGAGTFSLALPDAGDNPLPAHLPFHLVNTYLTADDEAADVAQSAKILLDSQLFDLTADGTAAYPREGLNLGLKAAAKTTTADSRRTAFFQGAGLGDLLGRLLPAAVPCTYPSGVVTPCNNEYAVFWGADGGGAFTPGTDGFNTMQGTLSAFGYKKSEINAQCRFAAGDEAKLKAIARAQTLILNVHGGQGGFTNWQCYEDVQGLEEEGPTQDCCERLKQTAIQLGVPNAARMDCTLPARQRPAQTPGGELRLDSTYDRRCPCSTGASGRCQIIGTNGVLTNLGVKAAVFTSQCYGGQCPAAGVPAVMDLFTQTAFSNYPDPEKCDDKRISEDVKGQAMYCRDTTPAPPDREPWRGQATGQCGGGAAIGLMPGAPSSLRTIQTSVETRGSWANGRLTRCQTRYTPAGWTQFNAANIGGNVDTRVEFAPAVGGALFFDWTGSFAAAFTSTVKTGCQVKVELSGGTKKTISTDPVASTATCGPAGVFVQLSGDPAWMSAAEWARPAAELRAFYGVDQSSWPWYIKITISNAVAPNGIKLVGNQGATKKWIWASPLDPSPVPPYLHSSGMFSQGGSTYEVWIPVPPSTACCMPNIEWTSPVGGGAPTPRQNGCTCAGGVGKDFCFVGTCVVCDEQGFCGNWSYPGMNPADCPGSYQRFEGTWHLWHDCCPVSVNGTPRCEATVVETTPPPDTCEPGDTGHSSWTYFQHIARPWDTSGPERCPPIEGLWKCVEH